LVTSTAWPARIKTPKQHFVSVCVSAALYRLTTYASSRTAAELLPEDAIAALKADLEEKAAAKAAAAAAAAVAAAASQQHGGADAIQTDPAAAAAVADAGASDAAAAEGDTAAAAADGCAAGSQQEAAGDVEMAEAQPPAADAVAAAAAAAAAEGLTAGPAAAAAPPAEVDDDAVKAAWLAQQDTVYQATKKQLEAIHGFETAIRRPYWHHKPLDTQQLLNWVAYLDWQQQQQQGGVAAMQRLFERCLVPCANYPGGCACL
jgi:hypothetical protein